MYVNPFWLGVLAALFVEAIALIALASYLGGRK
jgi:hypothetical protein